MRKNLRPNNNNVDVVIRQIPSPPEPPKNFFEKNQGFIQFLLVLLTFLTLVASIYFSNMFLQLSVKQLEQAKDQLTLAQNQFKESLTQRAIDKRDAHKNDSVQDNRFKIQNTINEKSLQAIELQAKIAKSQYESQKEINKEVEYQNRPIFILGNVRFDTIKNSALITIRNVGKRPVKISSSKVALFNISNGIMYTNIVPSDNSDLNEFLETTFTVKTILSIHKDPQTMYYLHFIYQDLATKQTQDFEKYFRWQSFQPNTFSWQELNLSDKLILIKKAKDIKFDLSL